MLCFDANHHTDHAMRTTVTLEDDVATELERIAFETRASFKSVINDLLRRALQDKQKQVIDVPFFMPPHYSGGLINGGNLDKATQMAGELEDDYLLQKLKLGK
jgi:hypothetical protein